MKSSAVDGKLTKAMRAEDGEKRDEGVVAEVHEVTGKDAAGAGTDEREDDANTNEDGDETPRPTELRAVHEAEQEAGQENSGPNAEGAGKERVKVAAEMSLFDQRSDENGHGHEHEGDLAVFEELLHWKVLWRFHARGDNRDKQRQAATRSKIDQRIARQLAGTGFERPPAERLPKGVPAQNRERYIQEEENRGVPEQHAANRKLRLGEQIVLELGSGQVLVLGSVLDGHDALNENQAGKAEKDKQDEMRPRPRDLQIGRIGGRGGGRRGFELRLGRRFHGGHDGIRKQFLFSRSISCSRCRVLRRLGRLVKWIHREARFPGPGQPETRAAASNGNKSSWWPVMA